MIFPCVSGNGWLISKHFFIGVVSTHQMWGALLYLNGFSDLFNVFVSVYLLGVISLFVFRKCHSALDCPPDILGSKQIEHLHDPELSFTTRRHSLVDWLLRWWTAALGMLDHVSMFFFTYFLEPPYCLSSQLGISTVKAGEGEATVVTSEIGITQPQMTTVTALPISFSLPNMKP